MEAGAVALKSVLVSVLVALVAGCVSGASPTQETVSPTSAPPVAPTAEVSGSQGAIRGTVTDEELQPVANATISLARTNAPAAIAEAQTGAVGVFGFSLLDEGEYLVSASAVGHGNASVVARVMADHVSDVTFAVPSTPKPVAFVAVTIKNGLIHCEVAVVASSGNSCGAGVMPANDDHFNFNVESGHRATVFESKWTPSNAAMLFRFELYSVAADGKMTDLGEFGNLIGPPVARRDFHPGDTAFQRPAAIKKADRFPASDVHLMLGTQAWYAGNNQPDVNRTLTPVCQTSTYCSGVGLALDQRFTEYVSVFHLFEPGDLSTYSALPDQ